MLLLLLDIIYWLFPFHYDEWAHTNHDLTKRVLFL